MNRRDRTRGTGKTFYSSLRLTCVSSAGPNRLRHRPKRCSLPRRVERQRSRIPATLVKPGRRTVHRSWLLVLGYY